MRIGVVIYRENMLLKVVICLENLHLLGINDYISFRDFNSRFQEQKGEDKYSLLESLIRIYTNQLSENPKSILSRYYDLLFNLPNTKEAKSIQNHIVIEDIFESLMDFPLNLFFILGFCIYSPYTLGWKDNEPPSNEELLIDRNTFFSKTTIPKDKYNKFLDYLTISKEEFISEHRKNYPEGFGLLNDFTILRKRPLVSINDHQSVAVNTQWLYGILGEGVFWIISDLLGRDKNTSFRTFFGELYQMYFTNIFRRLFPLTTLQQRAFFDVVYDDSKRSSDAIIYYPNTLIFFEAKWPTLRMNQTMIPGDIDAFNQDVDRIIVHAAAQLHRNIDDFINGKLLLDGINPSEIETFYPVIVTARPFPVGLKLTSYILDRVNQSGWLSSLPKIRKLEIICIEELEYMEPLIMQGKTFPDIIDRKQSSQYNELPMRWHIFKNETVGSKMPSNNYIDSLFDKLTDKIMSIFF